MIASDPARPREPGTSTPSQEPDAASDPGAAHQSESVGQIAERAAQTPATRPHAIPASRSVNVSGLLIVDKPTGVTSHDVIDVVRRRFREKGAGHLGTLDPAASGLLAVALGAATRCVTVWQGGEKTYEATLRLGVTTKTQDTTGEVIHERPVLVNEDQLREVSRQFEGDLMQVPPMVSALRVGGERLYRLARRGITVEREPRAVHIVSWEWLEFNLPLATFRVRCSGGTYVRTLAHDLGERLGTGAALHALRRVKSAPFDLSRSVTVRELYELDPEVAWSRAGIPLDRALESLPALVLDDSGVRAIGHGGVIELDAGQARALPLDGSPRSIVFRDPLGHALALGDVRADGATWRARPHVVFPWAVREGHAEER